ncbi:MAG: sensor histidine kinase [Lachnospiraceae bacterium]|nr:sensor histidine kinase [Lachnospiraceae bacterium]
MDRRGRKKITYYMVCILITGGLFLSACGVHMLHLLHLMQQQETELVTLYPELSRELVENAEYYRAQMWKSGALFLMGSSLVLGLSLICLFLFLKKRRQLEMEDTRLLLEAVCEQLEQFQKGNFKRSRFWTEQDRMEEDGVWLRISELLRELGMFYEGLREQLVQEENSTKALITDISHQLKTPLASLRLSYELTKTENLTKEEQQEFMEKEEQEIIRLELLLEELMQLSRLENHMIRLNPVPAGIRNTISGAVSQMLRKAQGKQIELQVELSGDIMVMHDVKWTTEALINVLDNAVKYSGTGTTVQIRVTRLTSNVRIEMEDEGMGIPEEELYHIFERFYRGKVAGQQVKEGAGVGLYLARTILERQGGTIMAKRKLTQGTVMVMTLPLAGDT